MVSSTPWVACQIWATIEGWLVAAGIGAGSVGCSGAACALGLAAFGSGEAVVGAAVGWATFGADACAATIGASIAGTRSASFGASALAGLSVGSLTPMAVPGPDVTFFTVPGDVGFVGRLVGVEGDGVLGGVLDAGAVG